MTKPIIHLNGTSAQSLTDDYVEAMCAVSNAIDKVSKHAAPNGRDYYPQGDAAIDAALAEHRARLTKLAEVKASLRNYYEANSEKLNKRKRLRRNRKRNVCLHLMTEL